MTTTDERGAETTATGERTTVMTFRLTAAEVAYLDEVATKIAPSSVRLTRMDALRHLLGRAKDATPAAPLAAFYRSMLERAACGCLARDCVLHGAYDGADHERLDREGVRWRR